MSTSFVVNADHGCLPGHFPARAVVPAVVLLERVIAGYGPPLPGRVSGIQSAKFTRAVLPGQRVTVSFEPRNGFVCEVEGVVVARGRLRIVAS